MYLKKDLKWQGQEVYKISGNLEEVLAVLPEFETENFGIGENINPNLLKVIRKETKSDPRRIPVAVVSKRYALIQHKEIVRNLQEAIFKAGFNVVDLNASLYLSQFGERMFLTVSIPGFDFHPGDGHTIGFQMECQNSVDKSCSLKIRTNWLRLECTNGLVVRKEDVLKKVHNVDFISSRKINDYLSKKLAEAPGEATIIRKWEKIPVNTSDFRNWIEKSIRKSWGVNRAARVYFIATTGYDGELGDGRHKEKIHNRVFNYEEYVPGSTKPLQNLFQVNQALSWVASRERNLEDRLEKLEEIPGLMQKLIGKGVWN